MIPCLYFWLTLSIVVCAPDQHNALHLHARVIGSLDRNVSGRTSMYQRHVYACLSEWDCVCVCVWERDCVCKWVRYCVWCVCVCVCQWDWVYASEILCVMCVCGASSLEILTGVFSKLVTLWTPLHTHTQKCTHTHWWTGISTWLDLLHLKIVTHSHTQKCTHTHTDGLGFQHGWTYCTSK